MAAAKAKCEAKIAHYARTSARITPEVMQFRDIETSVAGFVEWCVNHFRQVLILLFLICGATATALRGHISLRPIRTVRDSQVSEAAQLIANMLLLWSAWAQLAVDDASGVALDHAELPIIWMLGFGVMGAINISHLARPGPGLKPGGSFKGGLLAVPLYATMCLIAGTYFLTSEGYTSGLSTYLGRLPEHAILYIHVGLYVWAGMLLKQSDLAQRTFALIRPWKLPPELLGFVVVAIAAIPTAYSGASGIFVIATGGVIYQELRRAGARRQLALAATAMSGSLGVVLRPCLLVVIVASLNQEVTTDQLFEWGYRVFGLTIFLFLIASLAVRRGPLTMAPPAEGMRGTLQALKALVPYALLFAAVIAVEHLLLNAHLDEHSAPIILPFLLIVVLVYDRRMAKKQAAAEPPPEDGSPRPQVVGFRRSIELATTECTEHIGALLLLMGLSVCLGGIIERADLMAMVPQTFGSVYLAMSLLVCVLVVIGMTMDPYGAVILVSATVADVAYRNGIDPVHFWMVVLVAFELGYLTPPVALNHLLTRQVVGDEEALLAEQEGETFYERHEKFLLPISVMATALIIVAFGPLLFG